MPRIPDVVSCATAGSMTIAASASDANARVHVRQMFICFPLVLKIAGACCVFISDLAETIVCRRNDHAYPAEVVGEIQHEGRPGTVADRLATDFDSQVTGHSVKNPDRCDEQN